MDRTVHAALRHRLYHDGAEPVFLRRRHRGPVTLGPAHREGFALGPPADTHPTPIRRERPVFRGIGSKLMQREPYRLGGSRL
jgi:hypothetical protein